jgi:hypothetical protein
MLAPVVAELFSPAEHFNLELAPDLSLSACLKTFGQSFVANNCHGLPIHRILAKKCANPGIVVGGELPRCQSFPAHCENGCAYRV